MRRLRLRFVRAACVLPGTHLRVWSNCATAGSGTGSGTGEQFVESSAQIVGTGGQEAFAMQVRGGALVRQRLLACWRRSMLRGGRGWPGPLVAARAVGGLLAVSE